MRMATFSSYNGYNDELVWAALWLYKATGTQSYLTYATNGYSSNGFSGNTDVLSWDSKVAGIKILLAQITGQSSYLTDVQNLCDYFINQVPKSPLGEVFFSQWGSLRYASNAAFICLMVSQHCCSKTSKHLSGATLIVDVASCTLICLLLSVRPLKQDSAKPFRSLRYKFENTL